MRQDSESVVEVAAALISIESVNPGLAASGAGEYGAVEWCARWLTRRGWHLERVGDPGRPSLIARSGRRGGRTLMLNGHLDTVGLADSDDPLRADTRAVVESGRLYGRGAYDMKAGIAAMLVAADNTVASGIDGEVVLTLVADEEFASTGTEDVLRLVRADGAIVTEPTGGCVVLAHRGFAWFEVEFEGRAAHGSMPEQGVDAIAAAGRLLAALDDFALRLRQRGVHPLLDPGTVRVATIAGGSDAATVADRCVLTVERRFLPGESADAVEDELRSLVHSVGEGVPGLRSRLRRIVARGAFEADPAAAVTRAVLDSVRSVDAHEATVRGEPFWTDAGLIAEAGIPVLVMGPDGDGPHADVEWADIASMHRLVDVLERSIRSFCSSTEADAPDPHSMSVLRATMVEREEADE
ncbi:M20/M25/M40 family metallo-hydrolase [Microbacteriaceae bacterium VKM Ac-2855]|nr:M20/M25/M40 family metallo-hydrolase [Microbacteriaceae bacterium VKM Ac-2855]